MVNRQLRSWVFVLYSDNPAHERAINYIDPLDNSLYIKHCAIYDSEGKLIKKEHYHCVMRFENPYWLSALLKDLGLTDQDAHLFHSYKDFKSGSKPTFKSIEEYINYLDHVENDNKPDKYSPEDFHGGLKSFAIEIINGRDKERYIIFLELCNFIKNYNIKNFFDTRLYTFDDWYRLCCENGYGELFYKEWYKMRDILRAYINI